VERGHIAEQVHRGRLSVSWLSSGWRTLHQIRVDIERRIGLWEDWGCADDDFRQRRFFVVRERSVSGIRRASRGGRDLCADLIADLLAVRSDRSSGASIDVAVLLLLLRLGQSVLRCGLGLYEAISDGIAESSCPDAKSYAWRRSGADISVI
jgi:hypothetical protein